MTSSEYLRKLDIACSRILGVEPFDRTAPYICPCALCRSKAARKQRKYKERPSIGTHAQTLRKNRIAFLNSMIADAFEKRGR